MMRIKISSGTGNIKLRITDKETALRLKVSGNVIKVGDYKHYEGSYEVTPSLQEQKINTAQKVMDADMTIAKIPITVMSNSSGGNTVIIGG